MVVTIIVGLPNSSSAKASCFCLFGFSEYFGHGTVRHGTPTLDMQAEHRGHSVIVSQTACITSENPPTERIN